MLKTIRKHGITLALFAAGSAGLTAAINQMTKSTIAEQAAIQQKALFDQVLPTDHYNNRLTESCYLVNAPELGKGEHRVYIAKQDDQPVAAVLEATAPDGYSGAIQLLVGADFSGTILGTRVTEHHETPGLGDKIERRLSDWITLFAGKKIDGADDRRWAVKKMVVNLTSSLVQLSHHVQSLTPSNEPDCTPNSCQNNFLNLPPVENNNERD